MKNKDVFTVQDCFPLDNYEDITGKVVVLDPDIFLEKYQDKIRQLYYVIGGFGAKRNLSGRAVFGRSLLTKETERYERYNFLGVLDENKMPKWAQKSLQEIIKQKEQENE